MEQTYKHKQKTAENIFVKEGHGYTNKDILKCYINTAILHLCFVSRTFVCLLVINSKTTFNYS